jgi:2-polyprenyl-3-methyl-5-hydroxy-6-metoxy-1,4-benzoquinol methylase
MPFDVDPQQDEIRELRRATRWADRDVLEIGSGGGRLSRRLAELRASVTGIDADAELAGSAAVEALEPPGQRTRYVVADGRRLPFSGRSFDIVVFGWSL